MKLETSAELEVGKAYLFRTVTMIYVGAFISETPEYFIVNKAAWIADTGRWHEATKTGEYSEVEPYPADRLIRIYKSGMLDICEVPKLALEVK